jgi:hypothetical protein
LRDLASCQKTRESTKSCRRTKSVIVTVCMTTHPAKLKKNFHFSI